MHDARVRGRCLCGAVTYEGIGSPGRMWYCHCRECRKASGVGLGTWLEVPGVRWLSGMDHVRRFAASPAITRAFCSLCATVLPAQRAAGDVLLPAGGLEEIGGLRPCGHASAARRPSWMPALGADLPALQSTGSGAASSTHGSRDPTADETTARGSCLCGAIAFEVSLPLAGMRACHCSRCRRRSGSSWFVGLTCQPGALRFERGAHAITRWHMPGTRYYAASFCGECGALAPAVLPTGIFLAAGCLDSDPGARALCHVYYGSRAPWVEVRDGLPRFDEFAPADFNWQRSRP